METQSSNQTNSAIVSRKFSLISSFFQAFMSSADSLANTFVFYYAIGRGSVGFIHGLIVSVRELGSAIIQPIWGRLSDIKGRKLFVIMGMLIQSFSWGILMPLASKPIHILLILVFQTTMGTMAIPSWSSWIGDFTLKSKRGGVFGKLAMIGSYTGMIVLLVVTLTMDGIDPDRKFVDTYSIAFRMGGLFYLFSAIVAFLIPSSTNGMNIAIKESIITPSASRVHLVIYRKLQYQVKLTVQGLKVEYKRIVLADGLFRVAWSTAWPIFPFATLFVTQDLLDLTLLSLASILPMGLSQYFGGKLSDRIGRRRVIIWSRLFLVLPPFLFALGVIYQNILFLYISNFIVGATLGASVVSLTSFILDVAPDDKNGTYLSLHMMAMGILAFTGSIIMGLVLNYISPTKEPSSALISLLLMVVACIRFIAWFSYFLLPKDESIK
ncbi:MAG: MFS transporter [Candidatus Heimdallarchaeota archaeon]|nr:MFS transporter [Candidatus Heimdallarchaeota archaeon]MDH5645190.1 MFS transporter [Candidatus Heimdallarchaeota archaeon]